jgi:hypothetical protein
VAAVENPVVDPSQAEPLLVTLDTTELDDDRFGRVRAAMSIPYELAYVTVSARERGDELPFVCELVPETGVWDESRWGESVWGGPIPELLVLDESRLDEAVLADDGHVDVLETALQIIASGSFPRAGERTDLSQGQRHQLRDAMVFEAHVRHRRHVLVTNDQRGFIHHGRRRKLQYLGRAWIMTLEELEERASADQLTALLSPPPA